MCLDMPKLGGPRRKKKKCLQRTCIAQNKISALVYAQEDLDIVIPSKWFNDTVCLFLSFIDSLGTDIKSDFITAKKY